ncbi:probable membrane-associated kinase regulator 2 [Impatiens glandulifera]|uniref:probable membrane-associated kinase regulator 2 n=1 Tax=Impatiens glandulifera TaxID=253017 RepID=UPI001FB0DEFE|nr:probable membrane-associated kinase regulator 2 [Impatiens glandulifera]
MEAFSMLNFWRITPAAAAAAESTFEEQEQEEDEEIEDSFFDLEFGLPASKGTQTPADSIDDDSPTKLQTTKPLSPTSFLLTSPPKFPVFMLFKKSKCRREEVKSEEELEEVRISSILQGIQSPKRKYHKQNSISKKKKLLLGKDMLTRYAKLIKPLYVKVVSRRTYGESVKISDENTTTTTTTGKPSVANLCSPMRKSGDEKQGPISVPGAGLRVVCKQYLRKSLNGSSSSGMVPIPIPARRDDRLMEQHDGIQGAILHCKRSYNNSSSSSSSSGN